MLLQVCKQVLQICLQALDDRMAFFLNTAEKGSPLLIMSRYDFQARVFLATPKR